jgi:small-conductance mechanosensitive channel
VELKVVSEEEKNLFRGYGIEVELNTDEDFLKVKETLQRIGVASKHEKKLYQSCHILHKRGRYSIVHFKEMFALDGKTTTLSQDDINRRNTIAKLLHEWNLLTVLNTKQIENCSSLSSIKVLSYNERDDWELVQKYSVGTRHR